MAIKKKGAGTNSKALTKWDQQLANLAAAATKTEEAVGAGGNFIKLAGGVMTYKGATIPGNKMKAVIADHVLHNAFYEGKYDPDNPTAPVCFAFAKEEDAMAPHADSPTKQSDTTCGECPANEFGSADTGKGKACKNIRRLALISEGDLDNVAGAEIAYMHVPVMSVKGWAGYVRQINELFNRPPLGVVTEISLVPDPKAQFKVVFNLVEQIEDGKVLEALLERLPQISKDLPFPYVQIEAAPPAPARGRGRAVVPARKALNQRKFAARK